MFFSWWTSSGGGELDLSTYARASEPPALTRLDLHFAAEVEGLAELTRLADLDLHRSLGPEKLESLADYLTRNGQYHLVLEGHCDDRGSEGYNRSLGERRAIAVRNYLVALGVSEVRMKTISYGEERPAASGNGEAVWRQNRRAEIIVVQP